jgi:hypothetical protein
VIRRLMPVALVCLLAVGASTGVAADKGTAKVKIKTVQKQISGMNNVLETLLLEAQKAKEKNDVRRLNCLLVKINLVKGLIQASDRAKLVMMEALYADDAETTQVYARKIDAYGKNVEEVGTSLDECSQIQASGEGTTLLYIRPEEGPEEGLTQASPWDWGAQTEPGDYPVVPPASPYR